MLKGQTLPESRKKDTLRERLLTANNKLKQANFEIEQLKEQLATALCDYDKLEQKLRELSK